MENTEKVVYLDNAATTACAPEALAVMVEALNGACGNPSSHYSVGYEAKEFVDKGRAQVAKAINASTSEIFFTGCGSEADNWAVKGTAFTKARQNKKHLITSAFEHHAIMHSMAALERLGFEVTYIKPTTEGYIRPEDVEMQVFRSSGAGGQHINKTSSAVRLIHKPTGIVVSCQTQRSQFQNRDYAMEMLKAKLYQIAKQQHMDKIDDIKGVQNEIAWGHQIRSYVFMPYTMVKDHRTNYETGNVDAVMDGDLDGFIFAYLKAASRGELQDT